MEGDVSDEDTVVMDDGNENNSNSAQILIESVPEPIDSNPINSNPNDVVFGVQQQSAVRRVMQNEIGADLINYPRDEDYYNETSDMIWDAILVINGVSPENLGEDERLKKIRSLFKKIPITKEILDLPDDLIKRDIFADFCSFYYKTFHMLSQEEREKLFKLFPEMEVNFKKIIDSKIENNVKYAKLGLYGTREKSDYEDVYELSRNEKIIQPEIVKEFLGLSQKDQLNGLRANFPIFEENGIIKRGLLRRGIDSIYTGIFKGRHSYKYPYYNFRDGITYNSTIPDRIGGGMYHPIINTYTPKMDPDVDIVKRKNKKGSYGLFSGSNNQTNTTNPNERANFKEYKKLGKQSKQISN